MKGPMPLETCQCGHPEKHHHNEPLIGCVICGCRKFVLPASKCRCGHLVSYHHSPLHGVACVALHCGCPNFVEQEPKRLREGW